MWLAGTDLNNIESLIIDGYADEMGTEAYNYDLSKRRAEVVAQWLSQQGIKARARVTGKGQIFVNNDSLLEVPFYDDTRNTSIWNHRIWMNRKARRVDIKAVIK